MRIKAFFLVFILVSSCSAIEWQGKCLDVTDGDTVIVMYNELPVRVRLHGIDAPEGGQDFGRRAKQRLAALVKGKTLRLQKMDVDQYYRVVARLWLDGVDINREMVASGMAWVTPRYCTQDFCENWQEAETEARNAKLGLWAHPNPLPPWDWRRERRRR